MKFPIVNKTAGVAGEEVKKTRRVSCRYLRIKEEISELVREGGSICISEMGSDGVECNELNLNERNVRNCAARRLGDVLMVFVIGPE